MLHAHKSSAEGEEAQCNSGPTKKPPSSNNWADQWASVKLPARLTAVLAANAGHELNSKVSFYEGFGSFHSENVEDLMARSDAEYKPPACLPTFAKRILSKEEIAMVSAAHQEGNVCSKHTATSVEEGRLCKRARVEAAAEKSGSRSSPRLTSDIERITMPVDGKIGAGYVEEEGVRTPTSDDGSEDGSPTTATTAGELLRSASAELIRLCGFPALPCAMGAEFRRKHFTITPDMVFVNHGAFGSALAGAVLIKRLYEEHMEKEVVKFVDRELLPLVVYSIRSLSRFVHADPRQIILLQNATYALNCAMRLIEKDDVVAFLDTEYLAVYKIMWFRCQEVGAPVHEIAISKFLHDTEVMGSDDRLTEEICRQLPAGCTTMVIDYVTSTSALCLPIFTHLVPALRKRGVQKIIVDGAHAPLQLELNFDALPEDAQPTVFVGNLHKWFSSPKAAGFFWVRKEDADSMRSVVLSHGAGDGLLSEFIWDGTRDYGAYFSIPAIIDFWEMQGVERVRDYCSGLLSAAVDMLTSAFGSRKVARHSPFMSLVELPEKLQDEVVTATFIQDTLHDLYRTEVPVKRIEGRFYLRLSCFVYNTPEEYVYLREAVLSISEKWYHSDERNSLLQALELEKSAEKASSESGNGGEKVPCDERIRRQGGCGVSGLDPKQKRKRTKKFA